MSTAVLDKGCMSFTALPLQHLRLIQIMVELVGAFGGEGSGRVQVQQGPAGMAGQLAVLYTGGRLQPWYPCRMPTPDTQRKLTAATM